MGVEIEIEKNLIKFQLDYYLNISFNNNCSNIGKRCKNRIVVQEKKFKKKNRTKLFFHNNSSRIGKWSRRKK